MKIYAIRDRLIDYFQQPWAAPGDKEVLTAVAQAINTQENTSAIAQAPHHYEIWRIGEVDEQGHITAAKEFLADCSSLVRTSVRPGGEGKQGSQQVPSAGERITGALSGLGSDARPKNGSAANSSHAAPRAGAEASEGSPGGAEVTHHKGNY